MRNRPGTGCALFIPIAVSAILMVLLWAAFAQAGEKERTSALRGFLLDVQAGDRASGAEIPDSSFHCTQDKKTTLITVRWTRNYSGVDGIFSGLATSEYIFAYANDSLIILSCKVWPIPRMTLNMLVGIVSGDSLIYAKNLPKGK